MISKELKEIFDPKFYHQAIAELKEYCTKEMLENADADDFGDIDRINLMDGRTLIVSPDEVMAHIAYKYARPKLKPWYYRQPKEQKRMYEYD